MRACPALLRPGKGNSYVEYALLLALLGGTSATMVVQIGKDITQQYTQSTTFQQQLYAQARGATLTLTPSPLGPVAATAPFSLDLAPWLAQAGFRSSDAPAVWHATGMPAGLTLTREGRLEGQIAAGTHTFTVTVERLGIKASATATLTAA